MAFDEARGQIVLSVSIGPTLRASEYQCLFHGQPRRPRNPLRATSNRTWMWDGIVWQALMAGRENDVVF